VLCVKLGEEKGDAARFSRVLRGRVWHEGKRGLRCSHTRLASEGGGGSRSRATLRLGPSIAFVRGEECTAESYTFLMGEEVREWRNRQG